MADIEKLIRKGDVKGLMRLLQEPQVEVRIRALGALGELGDPRMLEPVAKLLTDRELRVRQAAIAALGSLPCAQGVPALLPLLLDRDAAIRESAANALEAAGWAPGQDPAEAVAYRIARGEWEEVARLGAVALPALLGLLPAVPDESSRVEILKTLGSIGDAAAIPAIVPLAIVPEQSWPVYRACRQTLAAIGMESLQALVTATDDPRQAFYPTGMVTIGVVMDVAFDLELAYPGSLEPWLDEHLNVTRFTSLKRILRADLERAAGIRERIEATHAESPGERILAAKGLGNPSLRRAAIADALLDLLEDPYKDEEYLRTEYDEYSGGDAWQEKTPVEHYAYNAPVRAAALAGLKDFLPTKPIQVLMDKAVIRWEGIRVG